MAETPGARSPGAASPGAGSSGAALPGAAGSPRAASPGAALAGWMAAGGVALVATGVVVPEGVVGTVVGVAPAPASGLRDAVVVDGSGRVVGLQRDASEDAALSELVPEGFLALSSDARDLVAGVSGSASLADLLGALLEADAPVSAVALDAGGAAPWSVVAF